VQEAVGNVARHANATQVSIVARGVGANLSITVTDDGVGLPVSLSGNSGLGLRSMRYRAERIGGSIQIETCAPHGTQIRLLCPAKGVRRN
jgi:signal transduction histidine kinase